MTALTRDDLALYAMGHDDGDRDAIEQLLASDPEARALLAEEAELERLLRDAASAATFCPRCHDLMRHGRCDACRDAPSERPATAVAVATPARRVAPPRRPQMLVAAVSAATLAAAAVIGVAVLGPRSSASDEARPPPAAPGVAPRPPAPARQPVTQPPPPPAKPPPPARTARAWVELRIQTRPAGVAVVLDHQYRGLTPLVVKVPRQTAPVGLSLQHVAYDTLVRQVVPREDTRLVLTLRPRGMPLVVHEGKYRDAQCMQCHKAQREAARGVPVPPTSSGSGSASRGP